MSAEKILETILNDAHADAACVLNEAKQAAKDAKEKAVTAAKQQAAQMAVAASVLGKENESRTMLTAGLDSRKNSLAARRALLDEAFFAARDKLCLLDGAEYASLVEKLMCTSEVVGNECVCVPKKDMQKYKKPFIEGKTMLEYLNGCLLKQNKPGMLSLSEEPAVFMGGALFIGEKCDFDCSFDTLIAVFRDTHEAEIDALLFGEEV
ncbi:MAG: V-type ATP synthase subunit E [Oscillospiraceae bacterium]